MPARQIPGRTASTILRFRTTEEQEIHVRFINLLARDGLSFNGWLKALERKVIEGNEVIIPGTHIVLNKKR